MPRTLRATAPARLRTPRKSPPSSFLRLEPWWSAQTPQGPRALRRSKPQPYTELFSSFSPYEVAASWWFPDPRHTSGLTLKRLCNQEAGLVFVRRRNSDINRRQKRENIRLNNRNKYMKPDKSDWNDRRKYSQDNA